MGDNEAKYVFPGLLFTFFVSSLVVNPGYSLFRSLSKAFILMSSEAYTLLGLCEGFTSELGTLIGLLLVL